MSPINPESFYFAAQLVPWTSIVLIVEPPNSTSSCHFAPAFGFGKETLVFEESNLGALVGVLWLVALSMRVKVKAAGLRPQLLRSSRSVPTTSIFLSLAPAHVTCGEGAFTNCALFATSVPPIFAFTVQQPGVILSFTLSRTTSTSPE